MKKEDSEEQSKVTAKRTSATPKSEPSEERMLQLKFWVQIQNMGKERKQNKCIY